MYVLTTITATLFDLPAYVARISAWTRANGLVGLDAGGTALWA